MVDAISRTIRHLRVGGTVFFLLLGVSGGCGVEGEIFSPLFDRGHVPLPDPSDTVLHGRASLLAGGEVAAITAKGHVVTHASIDEAGDFILRFSGTAVHHGLFLWGRRGDVVTLGVLPELPAQPTRFHEERHVFAWEQHASLADLNPSSTAISLMLWQAARSAGVGLDALNRDVLAAGLTDAAALMQDPSSGAQTFHDALAHLVEVADSSTAQVPFLQSDALAGAGSFLNADWLAAVSLPGGLAGMVPLDFDGLLTAASDLLVVGVCYPDDRIRVVFRVDMSGTVPNANCDTVDPFIWAEEAPGKSVFFTGGVHPDTPMCADDAETSCLGAAEVDELHAALGAWVPNQIRMFDDATHGDDVAGDGVWSVSFELPFFDPKISAEGAGVRLGYKYTWGYPGQGWTGSQEWPGNQRLLELDDLNGDHLVIRHDLFGDEASNKDKVNALAPSKGGCGVVLWPALAEVDCVSDTRENRVDTDGNCEPETWPNAGSAIPVTISCDP